MKSIGKKLLIGAVVVFSVVLITFAVLIGYILIEKPLGIEFGSPAEGQTDSTYDHPLLTAEQEQALDSIGIDTTTLPEGFTAEQMACFGSELGEERVQEIEAGSTVTLADYLKAKNCVE